MYVRMCSVFLFILQSEAFYISELYFIDQTFRLTHSSVFIRARLWGLAGHKTADETALSTHTFLSRSL